MRRTDKVRGGAIRFISFVGMLLVIVGGFGWQGARAEIQNDAIGFTPNHVLESSNDGEHIDVLSGNMTLVVPLGPRYKLTDDLTWGITLHYNSKIWDHICPCVPDSVSHSTNACPLETQPTDTACVGSMRHSDLGMGWSMRPGHVYHDPHDKSYVYRAQLEDGAEHMFCWGGSDTTCPAGGYAVDGSNIKIQSFTTPDNKQGWKAFLPDGHLVEFGYVVDEATHEAYATRIATRRTRLDGKPMAWVDYPHRNDGVLAEDSQGRTISLSAPYPYTVWTLNFPAYTDPVSSTAIQPVYKLTFADVTFWDPTDTTGTSADVQGTLQHIGAALKSIEYPSPSPQTEAYTYTFDYLMRDGDGNVMSSGDRTNNPDPLSYGWLTRRTLPTGAFIDYSYDVYQTSPRRPYHTELIRKTLHHQVSGTYQKYEWTWERFSVDPHPAPPSRDPLHPNRAQPFAGSNPYRVAVRDPFNNLTLYMFNWTLYDTTNLGVCNVKGECTNNWSDGLLASVSTFVGSNPDTAHLVKQVEYKWDSDTATDASGETVHTMFQYRTPTGNTWPNGPLNVNTMAVNVRQTEEKTTTPGNESHSVTVKSSHWYQPLEWCFLPRQRDEYIDDVLYRSTYRQTEPDNGGNCNAHRYVEVKDAWGNVVSRVDSKYNQGRLECEVRRKGTNHLDQISDCSHLSMQLGDVATVNTFDDSQDSTGSGEIVTTAAVGGDLSTTDSRTVTNTYRRYSHTYTDPATGTQVTETGNTPYVATKNYGFTWNAINRDVDLDTGWTRSTHDPAGNTTRYSWDALGRLTQITPGGANSPEKPTLISYPHINETHVTQSLSSSNFVETIYFYDDLGRLITTKRRNAAGTYDVQNTQYDIAGRVTAKSEWAPDGTASTNLKWTTYDYTMLVNSDSEQGAAAVHADPLGRVHGVTTPDDLTPDTPTIETKYDGNITTVVVRDINGYANNLATAVTSTTVYTKDALDRLIAVAPASGAKASYTYDESNNLVEVKLTDPADSSKVQYRHFGYDRLGRLRAAINPENGTVVYGGYDPNNPTVFYGGYDARGNLTSYTDAKQTLFSMTYDNADRLLTRKQSGVVLLQNTYNGATSHLDQQDSRRSDGTLVSTVKFHYGDPDSQSACPSPGVGYSGLNGRLVWQKAAIQPWGVDVETDFCEDALGMPTTTSYPDYSGSGRLLRGLVTPFYQNGYLTSIADQDREINYVNQVTYGPGGVPTEIYRVGSKDLIQLDVRNRPARFQSIGYTYTSVVPDGGITCDAAQSNPSLYPAVMGLACGGGEGDGGGTGGFSEFPVWDSGAYTYDMAGNVQQIGSERYYYDQLNRLIHASMPESSVVYSMDYSYDAFGNMTGQNRGTGPSSGLLRTYSVDWRNNRLLGQTSTTSTSSDSATYTFDENGNVTSGGSATTGAWGYVYDSQNRLSEVMDPENGRAGKYDYDGLGYRVRAEAGGNETFYFRDASGQVLGEFQRPLGSSSNPVWNRDYIYAFGKSFALIKNDTPTNPNKPVVTAITQYVNSSHLGSVSIRWDPVSDPDILSYHLERRSMTGANTTEAVKTFDLDASTLTWTDNFQNLNSNAAGTYFKYRLLAMDTAGNLSDYGPQLIVFPYIGNPAPSAPTNVQIVRGEQMLTITWNPVTLPNNDLLGYYVERSPTAPPNATWTPLNSNLLTSTDFIDAPLPTNRFWYAVHTVDTSNRVSAQSSIVTAKPGDLVGPGEITEVFADPDPLAALVDISWFPGSELDVAYYVVYQSTTAGSLGAPVGCVSISGIYISGAPLTCSSASQGRERYDLTVSATEGMLNYFTVLPYDYSGSPTRFNPADQVSARPRVSSLTAPTLSSALFGVDNNGTVPAPGGGQIDNENDDRLYAAITWPQQSSVLKLYRKASDELSFKFVNTIDPSSPPSGYACVSSSCTYYDYTVTKNDYTYLLVVFNGTDESAASSVRAFKNWNANQVSVRALNISDGREFFASQNKASRLATVGWSRVVAPGLVGYNVYRMCSMWLCPETSIQNRWSTIDAFTCEPEWMRLNLSPLTPDQTRFSDAYMGGLQGCFLYAVRPVGPNNIEGDITTIASANLQSGEDETSTNNVHYAVPVTIASDDPSRDATCYKKLCTTDWATVCGSNSDCPGGSCQTAMYCSNATDHLCSSGSPCSNGGFCDHLQPTLLCDYGRPNSGIIPFPDALDVALNDSTRGINKQTRPGTPTSLPPPVASATAALNKKDAYSISTMPSGEPTQFAQVSWSWESTLIPSNLAGFHIEMAGSVYGPWKRMTTYPVAWWQTRYTVQGVAVPFDLATSHTQCLAFRVISVDEDGNESAPVVAQVTTNANCPATPNAPPNLRASEGPDDTNYIPTHCRVQLDWDAVPAAPNQPPIQYFVYEMNVSNELGRTTYFQQHSNGTSTSYLQPADTALTQSTLHAFYVTAWSGTGGESPRSNLVFWDCSHEPNMSGYTKLIPPADSSDAIASSASGFPESRACWLSDGGTLGQAASIATSIGPIARVGRPGQDNSRVLSTVVGDRVRALDDSPRAPGEPSRIARASASMFHLGSVADPPWTVYDLHTDHLGSVRAVTNKTLGGGIINSRHDFFPFGEEVQSQFDFNTHMYTGHERDKETGLDYMLARYYEAGLGRFLSVDPGSDEKGELPQSWNKYSYTRDNPVTFFDPNGQELRPGRGADSEFFASFIAALDKAGAEDKTGRVQEALDRVRMSSNVFYVSPGDGEGARPLDEAAAQNGRGSGGVATFNEEGQRSENGEYFSPVEVGAHLLSHFEDYDSGTLNRDPECPGCAPVTEGKAVRMQNLVRDPKQPETTHYGRRVPNPRGTPKRPSKAGDSGHHVQTQRGGVSQDDVLTGH